jgi:hypothetical protein
MPSHHVFNTGGDLAVPADHLQMISVDLHRNCFRHEIGAPNGVAFRRLYALAKLVSARNRREDGVKSLLSGPAHAPLPQEWGGKAAENCFTVGHDVPASFTVFAP